MKKKEITTSLLKRLEVILSLLFSVVATLTPYFENVIAVSGSLATVSKNIASLLGAAMLMVLFAVFTGTKSRRGLIVSAILGLLFGAMIALTYLLRYNMDPIFPSFFMLRADQIFALAYILHFVAWVTCFAGFGLSVALRESEQIEAVDLLAIKNKCDIPALNTNSQTQPAAKSSTSVGITNQTIRSKKSNTKHESENSLLSLLNLSLLGHWEDIRNSHSPKQKFGYQSLFVNLAILIIDPSRRDSKSILNDAYRKYRLLWLLKLIPWPSDHREIRKHLLQTANQTLKAIRQRLESDKIINKSKNRAEIVISLVDRLEAILKYPYFFGYHRLFLEFRKCINDTIEAVDDLTMTESITVTGNRTSHLFELPQHYSLSLINPTTEIAIGNALILPIKEFGAGNWLKAAVAAFNGAEKISSIALSFPAENPVQQQYLRLSGGLYSLAAAFDTKRASKTEKIVAGVKDNLTLKSLEKLIIIAELNCQDRAVQVFREELAAFQRESS